MGSDKPTLGLVSALGWTVAVSITLQLSIAWLVALFPRTRFDIISLGAVEVLVLGAASVLLARKTSEKRLRELLRPEPYALSVPREGHFRWLGFGLLLGGCLKFPAGALRGLVELGWPTPSQELAAQARLLSHETSGQVFSLLLIVGLLGPLVEEVFYRGVLFRTLKNARGAAVSAVVVTVAFTLAHASPRDWGPLLLVSAVFTYVRLRSGTLWPSLAAHIAFNCATLLALATGEKQIETDVAPGLVAGTSLSVLVLLVFSRLSPPMEGRS